MIENGLKAIQSLAASPNLQQILTIINAAFYAVDPYGCVRRAVAETPHSLMIGGRTINWQDYERVVVVGAGKAGYPMARALKDILGERITAGAVVVKDGYLPASPPNRDLGRIEVFEARHPFPDERGVQATRKIIALLQPLDSDDLVFCLISGGGSALLTAPAEGITLSETQELTGMLLKSGATINEINTLRKHIDMVKGGGLVRHAYPASVITLILSDVVGDPLDIIASGPTVADPSTFDDCRKILEKYQLSDKIPFSIKKHLNRGLMGEIPDTIKPGAAILKNNINQIVGSNTLAAEAAKDTAHNLGFHTQILTTNLQGEAKEVGRELGLKLRELVMSGTSFSRPACLIAGGETTVVVRGKGLGGRNLETALGAINPLAGLKDVLLLTVATDGGDGPTDAAGAAVTGDTLRRANTLGLDPLQALENNDSYHFFERLGDLFKTGPTQTNVNDLVLMFAF